MKSGKKNSLQSYYSVYRMSLGQQLSPQQLLQSRPQLQLSFLPTLNRPKNLMDCKSCSEKIEWEGFRNSSYADVVDDTCWIGWSSTSMLCIFSPSSSLFSWCMNMRVRKQSTEYTKRILFLYSSSMKWQTLKEYKIYYCVVHDVPPKRCLFILHSKSVVLKRSK